MLSIILAVPSSTDFENRQKRVRMMGNSIADHYNEAGKKLKNEEQDTVVGKQFKVLIETLMNNIPLADPDFLMELANQLKGIFLTFSCRIHFLKTSIFRLSWSPG